jgi:hypothetical protein
MEHTTSPQTGDVIEVHGLPGGPARRGTVVDVLGAGEHEHYRVRWDDRHESLFFPSGGEDVSIVEHAARAAPAR